VRYATRAPSHAACYTPPRLLQRACDTTFPLPPAAADMRTQHHLHLHLWHGTPLKTYHLQASAILPHLQNCTLLRSHWDVNGALSPKTSYVAGRRRVLDERDYMMDLGVYHPSHINSIK